ncbi:hypothetical protein Q5P01_017184 [Channa striata]|uniref:Uncharacterized protein n=1 Tax=Channa striata TaxID=64152 RepID=A0AA88M925_CHASR|nr:hypothetical protein Q5P01_017184 [Channa striata]
MGEEVKENPKMAFLMCLGNPPQRHVVLTWKIVAQEGSAGTRKGTGGAVGAASLTSVCLGLSLMARPAVGVLSVGARGFRRRGGHENFHPPVLGGGSPPCLPSSERG